MNKYPLIVALLATVVVAARAEYMRPDLEKVPVARLIENLEKAVADNPQATEPLLNLARAHAMAYAKKADQLDVNKGNGRVWFGYEPPAVPFRVVEATDDPQIAGAAKAHLERALELYARVVELDRTHRIARLGHAWITAESGHKEQAVALYRALVDEAWATEKDLTSGGLGGHTVTGEAAGYLVPLLDADKDQAEIAALQAKATQLANLPRPITPIAVPLKGGLSAADLEDRSAAVAFDADGSGLRRKWSWITADAAWLVYDQAVTGHVTSGLQLFGNVTFWMFWTDGYAALRSLDDDGNGRLSGPELAGLALWHDANGNGVSDPGEVRPLAAYHIASVSCGSTPLAGHPDQIRYAHDGVTFEDGSTRPTYDLVLQAK